MLKERALEGIKISFLYTVRYILPYMPVPLIHMLADASGRLSYHLDRNKRRVMKEEMQKLLGKGVTEAEIDRVVRSGLSNYRKTSLETWVFLSKNRQKIRNMGYIVGKERLDEVLGHGRGAIICLSHFGAFKSILAALGYEGYKVHQIAANPLYFTGRGESAVHNKLMEIEYQCEQALPVNFIYLGKFLRSVVEALRNNEIIVFSMDGVIGGKRIAAPVLNRSGLFSTSAVSLSLQSGAPMLPAFMVRGQDGRHRIIIEEPISIQSSNKAQALEEGVHKFAQILSGYVRRYPCHYAMFQYISRMRPLDEGHTVIT